MPDGVNFLAVVQNHHSETCTRLGLHVNKVCLRAKVALPSLFCYTHLFLRPWASTLPLLVKWDHRRSLEPARHCYNLCISI